MVPNFFNSILHKLGYISAKEASLRSLSPDKRRRAESLVKQINLAWATGNIQQHSTLSGQLGKIFDSPQSKSLTSKKDAVRLIGGDIYGYRPAMARLYGLFQNNPFGIYSFIARHHWAVRSALQVIRDELTNDGFQLRAAKGTSKKRLKEVYQQLKNLKIFDMRIDIACHIKLFGNAWILPHQNLLGGPGMLELLAPPRLMPIVDPITDQIMGWEYTIGRTTQVFPVDKLFHLWEYTVDNYKNIGDPCLMPAILEIEADLAADSFNNQMFQKGGLMGIILNLKANPDDPISRDEEDLVEELQNRIDALYSGVKAAHSVMVTTNVEKVHDINPVGKLDASFINLHAECAKTVAQCLGVPPEKIAISRSQNLQYIPALVEDSVNAQFNKSLNALISMVDSFLNDRVLRDLLGITDVRIVASGRYGALTKNAADTINALAQAGPLITVNQALDRILGWEELPPDNPRGNLVLDNSQGRQAQSTPMKTDPPNQDMDLGKKLRMDSGEFIKWTENGYKGIFERREKTHMPDDTLVDFASYRNGELRFYENL